MSHGGGLHTVVIRTDFEGLVSPHHQSGLVIFLVVEKSDITRASLFPLSRISVELEEFRSHLKGLVLCLLVRLRINLLGQMYDRLEMEVFTLLDFL
jgi:hypothetical protein